MKGKREITQEWVERSACSHPLIHCESDDEGQRIERNKIDKTKDGENEEEDRTTENEERAKGGDRTRSHCCIIYHDMHRLSLSLFALRPHTTPVKHAAGGDSVTG